MLIISLIIIALISTVSYVISTVKNQFIVSECRINCLVIESKYKAYLHNRGINHSENLYSQFLENYADVICPENCEVTYYNEDVICNSHNKDKQTDDEGNGLIDSIPFL
jgi:hypothetical protein